MRAKTDFSIILRIRWEIARTHDIGDLSRNVQASDRYAGASLIAQEILDECVVRWAFHRDTFVAVGHLNQKLNVGEKRCDHPAMAHLVVVDPVVCTNSIYTVVTSKICTTNGEVVDFDVETIIEDKVKLRAIDQDQIMNRSVSR